MSGRVTGMMSVGDFLQFTELQLVILSKLYKGIKHCSEVITVSGEKIMHNWEHGSRQFKFFFFFYEKTA